MITLDSALQETYYSNLLKGSSLELHVKSWDISQQFIPTGNGGNFDLSVSKSFSRLATIFVTYAKELDAAEIQAGEMYTNSYLFPAGSEENVQTHLTIGAKRWPEFDVTGTREAYWRLLMALGVFRSLPHDVNAQLQDFETECYVQAYDIEKVPMAMSTGENLQAGQDIQIHTRNFGGADQDTTARRAWVALHYEQIVEIKASGVHVLM